MDQVVSPRLARYFREYEKYHQTRGNERCHLLGIPMIMIALLGLLSGLVLLNGPSPIFRLDAGILLFLGAAFWYLYLDWRAGAPFSLIALGTYFLGRAIPFWALWTLFVIGWVFQLYGHYHFEKKSPAFTKNLEHLLIGPIWVFSRVFGYA